MTNEALDVAVLMLAFDEAARPAIQQRMDAIASSGDTSTPAGLLAMLRDAIAALRANAADWTHGAAENASPMPPAQAEEKFVEAAHRARSRFLVEVVRNFDGTTTRKAPPAKPATDAPGRVVVTFVVAARRELKDAAERTRASIDAALDDLCALTSEQLVAIEVVWSPADANDRMALGVMLERYPELFELDAPA
ncbi:MAG: DUF1517 domain-containing protein [Sandaracinaceae bacterium]|nr:DUF1517 domain-containing protein [Sandaracinaceae bacterium]